MTNVSPKTRAAVIKRDQSTCHYCHKVLKPDQITMDHIRPKSKGGHHGRANLVVACFRCNHRRGIDATTCVCVICAAPTVELLKAHNRRESVLAWFESFSAAR